MRRRWIWSWPRRLNFGLVQTLLAEAGTEILGWAQVDFAAREAFREVRFDAGDAQQPGDAVRLEFDEQVDIAAGSEVVAQGQLDGPSTGRGIWMAAAL